MRRIVLLILVLQVCADAAFAQKESDRPRVGLALAGGSARGFVQVGVLKWLEEHRVPVETVAGTSMGGGLAASAAVPLAGALLDLHAAAPAALVARVNGCRASWLQFSTGKTSTFS